METVRVPFGREVPCESERSNKVEGKEGEEQWWIADDNGGTRRKNTEVGNSIDDNRKEKRTAAFLEAVDDSRSGSAGQRDAWQQRNLGSSGARSFNVDDRCVRAAGDEFLPPRPSDIEVYFV